MGLLLHKSPMDLLPFIAMFTREKNNPANKKKQALISARVEPERKNIDH